MRSVSGKPSKRRLFGKSFWILSFVAVAVSVWAGLPGEGLRFVREVSFPDRVLIDTPQGGVEVVRYSFVTPAAAGTDEYKEALKVHREMVHGRMVRLAVREEARDADGNLLGFVYALDKQREREINVSAELVRQGLLKVVPGEYEGNAPAMELLAAQDEAKEEEKGIWRKKK